METREKRKSKKKVVILTSCLVSVTALVLSAFTGTPGNGSGSNRTETLYRESTVTRQDITVGVTESTVATLKNHNISFEFTLNTGNSNGTNQNNVSSIAIEEIYVKAGQSVKKGDPLVLMSSSDIQETLSELQADYQEAVVSLTDAQLSRQRGELDAKSSYNSTLSTANSADATYEITVEQLELAVKQATAQLAEIQTEVRTYTTLLKYVDNYEEDYVTYSSLKEDYTDAQSWVKDAQQRLKDYERSDDFDNGGVEHKRLQDNLSLANEELSVIKLEYEDAAKDYNKKYDTNLTDKDEIKEARTDAISRLEAAESNLKQAKYNLSTKTTSAKQTLTNTKSQAEIADTTYALELSQLENNVKSKQLSVDNIQEQVTKVQGYLDNNLLVAPCDGIVTTVSYSAGDSVPAGTSIMAISDSAQVYVYATIAQDDIASISLGQAASLTLDAFDELSFDGVVDSISTSPARNASGSASYSVTIQVLGDTARVYEGMTGSATLITRQQKDVLSVSVRTVYEKDGETYVKVKRSDGALVETPVITGFSDGRNVEITSGLAEGQIVVIESQVSTG